MALTQITHRDPLGVANTLHELLDLEETGTLLEVGDTDIVTITIETTGVGTEYLKMWDSTNPDIDTDPPDLVIPQAGALKRTYHFDMEDCFTTGMFALVTSTKNSGNTSANITQVAPAATVNVWVVTTPYDPTA